MISKPTLASVVYVAEHLRKADAEEIWPLRFDKSPGGLARTVMSDPTYVWVAAPEGGPPAVVFGAYEVRPRAWTAFAFATDEFPQVAGEVTKFMLRSLKPFIFNDMGAQRVEAWSHHNHRQAHLWLERLGAEGEPDPEYGPDGETYIRFVARRSDWLLSEAAKRPTLLASLGRKPDLASSGNFTPAG